MSQILTYSAFESRYKDRSYIGSGGFAKVFKVFDHAKNHYVALKIADVKPELDKFTLKNEVELVNKLPQHRNIARYDACYRFNTGSLTGEMDFAILRFYEYGNLEQFLKKEKISIEDKRIIIKGILEGVAFLHNKNVIHRDLKSQNILMHREDGVWTPKITDFGLSREIHESGDITNSAIGLSYAYAAPEQIQNRKILRNVDLWAAGVIIYRVITDELPFKGHTQEGDDKSTQSQLEVSRKIVNLEIPDLINSIAEPYQSVIKRCLVLDPEKRAKTAEELIDILNGNTNISSQPDDFEMPPEAPTRDDDKTQIFQENIPSQPQRPKAPPAQNFAMDEKTELVEPLPKVEQPPSNFGGSSGFNMPPQESYEMPKENVTQFFNQPYVQEEKQPPPVSNFTPNTGDPKRSYTWLWILIPLLLLGGGGGGYYWYSMQPTAMVNEKKKPIGKVTNNRYDTLDKNIEKHKTRKAKLLTYKEDIEKLKKQSTNNKNYRLHFLSAKVAAYTEKNPRPAFNNLKMAARAAILNGQAKNMLKDMEKDGNGAFKKIKKIQPDRNWNQFLKSLKEAGK